jgi:signal transduction histidine kinase
MSLRTRILVLFAVGVTIITFALAFTAQHIMIANLRADLDERLQLRTEVVASVITPTLAGSQTNYDEVVKQLVEQGLFPVPLWLRLVDPQGKVLAEFGKIPEPAVAMLNRQLSLPGVDEGRFDNIELKGGEELRAYTIQARNPSTSQAIAVIQTVDTLAHVDAAGDRLWQYALAEGAIGSALAIITGLFLLRRSFHPLDRILERVQSIRDTNLTAGFPAESRPPELQRLADNLDAMWYRLDAALRAKEAFVASVSHELRTPLTAIQGQIDSLLRRPSNDLEVKESLERTAREVRRLGRMTSNLLLNVQLDSSPALVQQQVNLRELVEEVIREMQVLAEGLDLGLKEGEDVVVYGDYDLLKQAVVNVIDNAVKFTPKEGHVQVSLGCAEGWVILEVSDSGLGIPREHLSHVMEPFYKVHRSGRSARGIGLGLAIVKQVIELHSGKVYIESQEGIGTRVKIYLPVQPSAHNANC